MDGDWSGDQFVCSMVCLVDLARWQFFYQDRLGFAYLAEISEQEKDPAREPLLTRVEDVVHQIPLNSNLVGEQIVKEHLARGRLIVENVARAPGDNGELVTHRL